MNIINTDTQIENIKEQVNTFKFTFKELVTKIFDQSEQVTGITWQGYTPSYCDGEVCSFAIYSMEMIPDPYYLEVTDYKNLIQPLLYDLENFLYANSGILQMLCGENHSAIINRATPDEITIEEYNEY